MDNTIRRGPLTLIFIFTKTCPHCHTYMPIWNKLCKTSGRKANMISMEASTYQQTPMSQKKPVSGVPTVLYVNKQGEIVEIDKPRDTASMKSVVRNVGPMKPIQAPMSLSQSPSIPKPSPMKPIQMPMTLSQSPSPMNPIQAPMTLSPSPSIPKPSPMNPIQTPSLSQDKRYTNSPLKPLPATGGHRGGNWDAILSAVPAAALLGAYAAFPMQRSSGLGPAIHLRKTRKKKYRH
jgi:thiol-disulfide isomerase/thioredoxin